MTKIKNRFTGAVLHEGRGTLQEELQKAIASRADLSRANLSGADLSGANLSGANLSRANLSGADLSRADLSRANLSWADLSWANLSGANLSGAGLSCLPIGDPRGYRPVAIWHDEWIVFAGCRRFTIAEAREHWGAGYAGHRETGDQYLAAMDWLEKQPKPEATK